jgi:hypothetical protein
MINLIVRVLEGIMNKEAFLMCISRAQQRNLIGLEAQASGHSCGDVACAPEATRGSQHYQAGTLVLCMIVSKERDENISAAPNGNGTT